MSNFLFRSQWAIHFLVGFSCVVILCLGFLIGKAVKLNSLQNALIEKGQIIKLELESELHHFANIANIYSNNATLISFLAATNKHNRLLKTNLQLLEIEQAAHASDVYLLQTDGQVVASSNWNRKNNFIDNNFSFRQYVKQAILTGNGFELAVGSVSQKRGAYFASLVKKDDLLLGILVVKANISKMETSEHLFPLDRNFSFMIQNDDNKIFLSDRPYWRLKTLQIDSKIESEQVLSVTLNRLWHYLGFPLWQVDGDNSHQQWLAYHDVFEQYPWHLKILGTDSDSTNNGILLSLTLGLSYIAFVSFFLFYRERRRNVAQLQRSHEHLIEQVSLRTKDLTDSNSQLSTEIEQRKLAETDLIAAQEQLVQAAKLATIGQLSSSINHELNQPIAALYSFLQTTEKMLDKAMYKEVKANINRMYLLTERLTAIVAQFKNFSKKTYQQLNDVSISKTVNNAMAIVSHHVIQHGVELKLKPLTQDIKVRAESGQLEQVIVNLLTNAVDAIADITTPRVGISFIVDEKITLIIKDNGLGIEPHYLNKIFEPFFTTKYHSGLGLGLSISRGIIASFNGELRLENNPDGGVIALISLPIEQDNWQQPRLKRQSIEESLCVS